MKEKADVVRGWLRKAASDLVTLEAALGAGAFDGACFLDEAPRDQRELILKRLDEMSQDPFRGDVRPLEGPQWGGAISQTNRPLARHLHPLS